MLYLIELNIKPSGIKFVFIVGVGVECKFCLFGFSFDRNWLEEQVLMAPEESSTSTSVLLETVVLLINPKLPWACNIVGYLLQRNTFTLFREIALTWKVWFLYHHSYVCSFILYNEYFACKQFFFNLHLCPQVVRGDIVGGKQGS